jgi:hypothetical protein
MANGTELFERWLEFRALCLVGNGRRHDKYEELIRFCLTDITDYWPTHLPSPAARDPQILQVQCTGARVALPLHMTLARLIAQQSMSSLFSLNTTL